MHCSICTASVVWVPNCTACTVWDLGGYVSVNVLRPITNNTAHVHCTSTLVPPPPCHIQRRVNNQWIAYRQENRAAINAAQQRAWAAISAAQQHGGGSSDSDVHCNDSEASADLGLEPDADAADADADAELPPFNGTALVGHLPSEVWHRILGHCRRIGKSG